MKELLGNTQPLLLALEEQIRALTCNCKAPPRPNSRAVWAR